MHHSYKKTPKDCSFLLLRHSLYYFLVGKCWLKAVESHIWWFVFMLLILGCHCSCFPSSGHGLLSSRTSDFGATRSPASQSGDSRHSSHAFSKKPQKNDRSIQKIEVLKLEKRLDDNLMYLRDALPEYSTVDPDMKPVPFSPTGEVPVNKVRIILLKCCSKSKL